MEVSRLRLLLLIAATASVLPGCAWFRHREPAPEPVAQTAPAGTTAGTGDAPTDRPIIDPQVERRVIKRPKIDNEDFEIGVYGGILSIEDFESHAVYGARLAYHLTEDFFLEGTVGRSRAGRTSYET